VYANRLNVSDLNCRRNDFDVCESTKVVSAKRPWCMQIDLYANRLVCESTCMRINLYAKRPWTTVFIEVPMKWIFRPFFIAENEITSSTDLYFPIWVILKSTIYWFPCLEVGHFELQMCDFQHMAKTCKLDLPITWPMVDACCLAFTLQRSNLTLETGFFLLFVVLHRTVI